MMNAHVVVYTLLAIVMGALVYVVGTPWLTPKPRRIGRKRSQKNISNAH